jgi:hypothetical protein
LSHGSLRFEQAGSERPKDSALLIQENGTVESAETQQESGEHDCVHPEVAATLAYDCGCGNNSANRDKYEQKATHESSVLQVLITGRLVFD